MSERIRQAIGRFSPYETILLLSVAAGFAYSLHALSALWSAPILEAHSFRQTQTALTVYWMLQGGPLLAYETPVVGAPWTIPFEFPLYQWSVLAVTRLGVPLDSAGRLVSWLYFAASVPLAGYLLRRLGLPRDLILVAVALWLFSPIYAFWSRAFLIESCAVFFSLVFLAGLVGHLDALKRGAIRSALLGGAIMVLGGLLAALVKITTFFGFALAGGAIVLHAMVLTWRCAGPRSAILKAMAPAFAVLIALAVTWKWVVFSDALKIQNPIGATLTSSALRDWNFGVAQLADPDFWLRVVVWRSGLDTMGTPVGVVVPLAGLAIPRARTIAAAGLALYVAPFLVFTNLHSVHNYYPYANALFLLLAGAATVWGVSQLGGIRPPIAKALSLLVLTWLLVGQAVALPTRIPPTAMKWQAQTLVAAQEAARLTTPDEAIFVFGFDWSSAIAYYAQRRAITVPQSAASAVLSTDPTRPQTWTGGRPLGGVVDCREESDPRFDAWIARLTAGRAIHQLRGCRFYF